MPGRSTAKNKVWRSGDQRIWIAWADGAGADNTSQPPDLHVAAFKSQCQAGLLGIPVVRPKVIETTALGAAYLAGLATGVWRNLDELEALWQVDRRFHPTLPRERAQELMAGWARAVRQATAT